MTTSAASSAHSHVVDSTTQFAFLKSWLRRDSSQATVREIRQLNCGFAAQAMPDTRDTADCGARRILATRGGHAAQLRRRVAAAHHLPLHLGRCVRAQREGNSPRADALSNDSTRRACGSGKSSGSTDSTRLQTIHCEGESGRKSAGGCDVRITKKHQSNGSGAHGGAGAYAR